MGPHRAPGKPTPLFDLMDKAPTIQKKVEVIQSHLDSLTDGQKGLAGALLAKYSRLDGPGMTYLEAATVVGMKMDHILQASHIIRAGTPQEVADVANGLRGINNLARIISKRDPIKPHESRKKGSNFRGRQVERRQRQQERAEMWHLLRAGLEGLTSLPMPSEVSSEIRKNAMMKVFTDERLDRAINWLKDFADAYRTQQGQQEGGQATDQVEAGDDPSDAGSSGRAA